MFLLFSEMEILIYNCNFNPEGKKLSFSNRITNRLALEAPTSQNGQEV